MNRFISLSRSSNVSLQCHGAPLSGYSAREANPEHSTYSLPGVFKRATVAIRMALLLATLSLTAACGSGGGGEGGGGFAASSTPAPISGAAQFVATFPTDPFRTDSGTGVSNDGVWWVEQQAGTNRVTVVNVGRDGGTGLRLHTEPGDNGVSGSNLHERADIALPQAESDGYEGRESWWAHSVLFPDDYVIPPSGTWNVIFNFHDTRNLGGQANFQLFAGSGGLTFRGHGGPDVVYDGAVGNQYSYGADIGPIMKNVWYDIVYHVKWSSGSDGYIQAWVNGVLKLDHRGPTLYSGYGVFLKLANYHSAFGQSSSVIHDRVVRGTTALSVSPGPLAGVLTQVNGVLTASQP